MDVIIRTAHSGDLPFLAEHDRHITPAVLDQAIRLGRVLILEEEGCPVGWMRWNLFWDNTPFMNMLFLLEGHRSKGWGRSMVNHWEQEMREAGYQAVMTSTQADEFAQHFYRHLGYRDVGSFALPGETLELILMKPLG